MKRLSISICPSKCVWMKRLFSGLESLARTLSLGTRREIKKTITYWDTNYKIVGIIRSRIIWIKFTIPWDCVRLQLRADVPVGAHLSGGMDSSLVSVLASKQLDSEISLFHGKFAEGANYDESEYAEIIAEQTQGSLHQTIPTAQEFADILPDLIYALDEPVAGPGLFPQYAVSKLAKEKVKVVLGGQGGDEIFGGYARYLVGYLEQALKGAIHETQEEGEHLVSLESIVPHLQY